MLSHSINQCFVDEQVPGGILETSDDLVLGFFVCREHVALQKADIHCAISACVLE